VKVVHCFHSDADDPDLWNQTLEAEDLQEIQSAVEKAEKQDVREVQSASAAQCGKKRRLDPTVRV